MGELPSPYTSGYGLRVGKQLCRRPDPAEGGGCRYRSASEGLARRTAKASEASRIGDDSNPDADVAPIRLRFPLPCASRARPCRHRSAAERTRITPWQF